MANDPRLLSESIFGAPVREVPYYFAAAASAGDWVMIDSGVATTITPLGGAAKTTTATADLGSVVGVVRLAVLAGTTGMVTVYGPVASAKVDSTGTPAFGDAIHTVATAGTCTKMANTDINKVGFATSASSGGLASVFVTCGGP